MTELPLHSSASKTVRSTLLIAWMGLIFWFSAETGDASGGRSEIIAVFLVDIGVFDDMFLATLVVRKFAHFTIYFVLGIFAYRFFETTRLEGSWQWIAAFALVVLYAVSDEVHQLFVDSRSGQALDVVLDSVGGAAGIAAYTALNKFIKTRSKRSILNA